MDQNFTSDVSQDEEYNGGREAPAGSIDNARAAS